MTALQVVLLVFGILGFQAILWIFILTWLKRRTAQIRASLDAEIAASGERVTRGPERATYRGSSAGHSNVRGTGVIALTDQRLIFRRLVGGPIDIAVREITGVREDKWFLGAYRGNAPTLIAQLKQGAEIGFIVRDHAGWAGALRTLTKDSSN